MATCTIQGILTDLVHHSLAASLTTSAVFFAERLHAIDTRLEPSTWLLAAALLRAGDARGVQHLLANTVCLVERPTRNGGGSGAEYSKVEGYLMNVKAFGASLRCAWIYAEACKQTGQYMEGLRHLESEIKQRGPPTLADMAVPGSSASTSLQSYYMLLGSLSARSHLQEAAAQHYRSALTASDSAVSVCWEAFEGLCDTGCATEHDIDLLVQGICTRREGGQHGSQATEIAPTTTVPMLGELSHLNHLATNGVSNIGQPHQVENSKQQALQFNVPKLRERGPSALSMGDMSLDDSSLVASFDQSYYALGSHRPAPPSITPDANIITPTNMLDLDQRPPNAPRVLNIAPASPTSNRFSRLQSTSFVAPSSSILTTPAPTMLEPKAILRAGPGVKRARSTVKSGVNGVNADHKHYESVFEGGPPRGGTTEFCVPSSSHYRQETSSSIPNRPTRAISNPREKKRVKASVQVSDLQGSSPSTLGPPATASQQLSQTQVPRDDDYESHQRVQALSWIENLVRKFALATLALSKFDCQGVLDAIWGLPPEQKRTWRAYCLIARAKFELLDYHAAELAFSRAREAAPFKVKYMDRYSTLLWHLRRPVQLACLAQELHSINPTCPETWIATGNVFSQIDDRSSALKCFKRASQCDETLPYAFTLAGHECVQLEEWERASGFFSEAVRRDCRHYNAWFGLGEVYSKLGKLKMAEFYFRESVKVNPTNALLWCSIGQILQVRGKFKQAKEIFEVAVQLAPSSSSVRFYRAKVLVALRQYEAAKLDLLILKDSEPTEFNVQFLLGKVYVMLGETNLAVIQFTLAQDLEPRCASRIRRVLEQGQDTIFNDHDHDHNDEGEGDGEEREEGGGGGQGNQFETRRDPEEDEGLM